MIILARNQFSEEYLSRNLSSRLFSEDFQLFFEEKKGFFVGTKVSSVLNRKLDYELMRKSKKTPEDLDYFRKEEIESFLCSFGDFSKELIFRGKDHLYSWKLEKLNSSWENINLERKKTVFKEYLKKYKSFQNGFSKANKLGKKLGFEFKPVLK